LLRVLIWIQLSFHRYYSVYDIRVYSISLYHY
jgi:hypothetical protein